MTLAFLISFVLTFGAICGIDHHSGELDQFIIEQEQWLKQFRIEDQRQTERFQYLMRLSEEEENGAR